MQDAGHRGAIREIVPTLVPGTAKHYGGAARMHASPKFGVTDGFNRLHEIPNVLVVDASCFTTGAEKNPTLTATALAARSADRLARDLRAM
jgi:choline dehydrogenase-like flavoprotein